MSRVYNFNPGPAALPLPVLEQVQQELLNYRGCGMSVMEISHRSKEYEDINAEAEARIKRLLGLGDGYRALFLQGGASLQFAMLPLNFLSAGATADYILTGSWSEKARDEATKLGNVHIAASTQAEQYGRIPRAEEIRLSTSPAYVHLTSNNTIYGSQWQTFPDFGDVSLVADMSSDILSRPFDASKFALIYAGTQKNVEPAGATIVLLRQSWLERAATNIPAILRYSTHLKNSSLYNTPPVFAVYTTNLVLGWIEEQGGLEGIGKRNQQKAQVIYDVVDQQSDFYRCPIEPGSRSLMNITFRLPDEQREKQFLSGATAAGLVGLKGHRSVGGVRASIYNAMTLEGCQALASYMSEFVQKQG